MNKRYINKLDKSFNDIKYIKENIHLTDVISEYTTLKRYGPVLKGLCPLHHESNPSFVVYERTHSFYCYGCKAGGDIFDFMIGVTHWDFQRVKEALVTRFVLPLAKIQSRSVPREIKEVVEEAEKPKTIVMKSGMVIPPFDKSYLWSRTRELYMSVATEEIYTYTHEDGSVAGYVLFFINKNGEKVVIPVSLTEKLTQDEKGTEIVWGMCGMPSPKPLFNLQEIIKNVDKKPILIVEGERCAAKAKALLKDFVVTTWLGGANNVRQTNWEPLEPYEVFIWPDNDQSGKAAAEDISKYLPDVEILQIPKGKEKGWDIADAIKEGKTEKEISEFILSFRVEKQLEDPLKFDFDMPPGLLGELTRYILSASARPHPLLAIGGALSILSILSGQKYKTEDNIHPNMYVVTLANSGVGKSFVLTQIKKILPELQCKKLLGGNPASGAGLVSALDKRQGRMLIPIDELGHVLTGILGSSSDSCQNNLLQYFLKLFSDSDTYFTDIEYSDKKSENPTRIINKPILSIYGTSVPDNFYRAITSDSALDGFMARLLVLDGTDTMVVKRDRRFLEQDMPPELYEQLLALASDPINILADRTRFATDKMHLHDMGESYDFAPQPLPFDRNGQALLDAFSDKMQAISAEAEKDNVDPFKASLYKRGMEHASKVALLAKSHGHYIDEKAVAWAIRFVESAIDRFYNTAKNYVHGSEFEKQLKDVERYLAKQGTWVEKKQMLNRFRIKVKILHEILDNLIQADKVEFRKHTPKSRENDTPSMVEQWRLKSEKKIKKI